MDPKYSAFSIRITRQEREALDEIIRRHGYSGPTPFLRAIAIGAIPVGMVPAPTSAPTPDHVDDLTKAIAALSREVKALAKK